MLIRWLLYLKLPKWVGSKIPMKHFEVNGRFKREGMFITTWFDNIMAQTKYKTLKITQGSLDMYKLVNTLNQKCTWRAIHLVGNQGRDTDVVNSNPSSL